MDFNLQIDFVLGRSSNQTMTDTNQETDLPTISHIEPTATRPPCMIHLTERRGARVVTIAHSYDKATGELTYGATIWNKTPGDRSWSRKRSNRTAIERFINHPVVIFTQPNLPFKKRIKTVRKALGVLGVRCASSLQTCRDYFHADTQYEAYQLAKDYVLQHRLYHLRFYGIERNPETGSYTYVLAGTSSPRLDGFEDSD